MSVESWKMASAMAEAGFMVFPLRSGGKKPLKKDENTKTVDKDGKGSFYVATTNVEDIEFWSRELVNCNYGVQTGTNVTVLDLDQHKLGQNGIAVFESWAKKCAIGKPEHKNPIEFFRKNTFVVDTPSNGLHIYFQFFDGISRTLTDGVEMQNWGRYVVGPGSQNLKGFYKCPYLENPPKASDLIKAPEWLRQAIKGCYSQLIGVKSATTKLSISYYKVENFGVVPIGARHDAVFMEIVELIRDELTQYEVYERINELILEHVPEPQDFSDGEIKRNIKNALKQHGEKPEDWLYE